MSGTKIRFLGLQQHKNKSPRNKNVSNYEATLPKKELYPYNCQHEHLIIRGLKVQDESTGEPLGKLCNHPEELNGKILYIEDSSSDQSSDDDDDIFNSWVYQRCYKLGKTIKDISSKELQPLKGKTYHKYLKNYRRGMPYREMHRIRRQKDNSSLLKEQMVKEEKEKLQAAVERNEAGFSDKTIAESRERTDEESSLSMECENRQ